MYKMVSHSEYLEAKKDVVYLNAWVYFFYHCDTLLYIGSTMNLKQRMSSHKRNIDNESCRSSSSFYSFCKDNEIKFQDLKMTFVQYTDITEQNLREQESANIAFFKPKYNGTVGVKVAMTQKRCVIGTQTSAEFDSKFCIRCTNLQRTVFENRVVHTCTSQLHDDIRCTRLQQFSLFDRFAYKKP